MLVKRVLLVVLSLAIGYGVTYFIVTVLLNTTVAEFWVGPEMPLNIPYFLLVGLFIALAVSIWLDKFMGTKILPK
jgi:hypothetical protein